MLLPWRNEDVGKRITDPAHDWVMDETSFDRHCLLVIEGFRVVGVEAAPETRCAYAFEQMLERAEDALHDACAAAQTADNGRLLRGWYRHRR